MSYIKPLSCDCDVNSALKLGPCQRAPQEVLEIELNDTLSEHQSDFQLA